MQITTEYPVIIRFILINQALNKPRQCHRVERALCSKFICRCATNKCFVLGRDLHVQGLLFLKGNKGSPCWSGDAHKGPLTNGIGSPGALGGAQEMPLRQFSFTAMVKEFLSSTLSVTSLNEC